MVSSYLVNRVTLILNNRLDCILATSAKILLQASRQLCCEEHVDFVNEFGV